MHISIITLFPQMIRGFFDESIVKRAQEQNKVQISIHNLRDNAVDSYGTVDDKPYGGGPGMVLKVEPVHQALLQVTNKALKKEGQKIILTSPRGICFSQQHANIYSKLDHIVIICGHYEGLDERVHTYVDEEISIGDFVLTGGEIVASAICDAVVRLIPGVLKNNEAIRSESYSQVSLKTLSKHLPHHPLVQKLLSSGKDRISLLEYPQYTRPETYNQHSVPKELLNGNHELIAKWRLEQSLELTAIKRPDLLGL